MLNQRIPQIFTLSLLVYLIRFHNSLYIGVKTKKAVVSYDSLLLYLITKIKWYIYTRLMFPYDL